MGRDKFEKMKVAELKAHLKSVGMAQGGDKGSLIWRANAHADCLELGREEALHSFLPTYTYTYPYTYLIYTET